MFGLAADGPMQEVPGDRQEASSSSGRHPAHRPFQPLRITTGASHRRSQRPHGRSDRTKMEDMPRLAGAHTGHIHHDSPEFPKYTVSVSLCSHPGQAVVAGIVSIVAKQENGQHASLGSVSGRRLSVGHLVLSTHFSGLPLQNYDGHA